MNAGDSGEPPRIKWNLPDGITAGAMQFPAPRRLPLGPLMDFGYEDEVLFPMTLTADSTLKAPSTAPLSAHVDWLVCREVCIPGKTDLALPLPVTAQKGPVDPARQALFDRFRARLPQPLPSSAKAVFGTTPGGFALALTGHPATNAEFFPLEQSQIVNAAPQPVQAVDGGVEISLKKDENFRAQPAQLNGVLVLGDGTAYEIHAPPGALPAAAGGAPPPAWSIFSASVRWPSWAESSSTSCPACFPSCSSRAFPWWKLPVTITAAYALTGWSTPWEFWFLSGPWLPCCWDSKPGDASSVGASSSSRPALSR